MSRILIEKNGRFVAGTRELPYMGNLRMILRTLDSDPASTGLFEADGIGDGRPVVSIYGRPMSRSWTLLDHPAMPSDTHIVVKDDVSDWEVGDRIAISGWYPNRGPGGLTPGFLAHMQSYDNAGLQMFLNNGDLNKNDGHDIPNNERGAILRRFQNDDHLVTHCSDTRCCRYDDAVRMGLRPSCNARIIAALQRTATVPTGSTDC